MSRKLTFWLMRRVLGTWEYAGEVEGEQVAPGAILVCEADKHKWKRGDYLVAKPESLAAEEVMRASLPRASVDTTAYGVGEEKS